MRLITSTATTTLMVLAVLGLFLQGGLGAAVVEDVTTTGENSSHLSISTKISLLKTVYRYPD